MHSIGLGTAATMGTVYSLVADHFPKNTVKVLSLVETAAGIAWVVSLRCKFVHRYRSLCIATFC